MTTLEDHVHAGTAEIMNSRDDPQRISLTLPSGGMSRETV